jgi:hypothetical protein
MTPKEKAHELVDKMYNVDFHDDAREISMRYPHAIKCAIIAVDEILNECIDVKERYWQDVKLQLEKL